MRLIFTCIIIACFLSSCGAAPSAQEGNSSTTIRSGFGPQSTDTPDTTSDETGSECYIADLAGEYSVQGSSDKFTISSNCSYAWNATRGSIQALGSAMLVIDQLYYSYSVTGLAKQKGAEASSMAYSNCLRQYANSSTCLRVAENARSSAEYQYRNLYQLRIWGNGMDLYLNITRN